MSSNFVGLLIILFTLTASVNVIMAVRDEPVLLAWLNQVFLGTILIAVVSYLVVRFSMGKSSRKGSVTKGAVGGHG